MHTAAGFRRTARHYLNGQLFAVLRRFVWAAQSVQRPSRPIAPAISAEAILRRADAVSFPQNGFEVGVDIRTSVDGKLTSEGARSVGISS